jgi:hypothetical protein
VRLGPSLIGDTRVRSAEVIVEALDVILPEVVAELNFYKHKGPLTTVRDSVSGTTRDVDGVARLEAIDRFVKGHLRDPGDNQPVFGPTRMTLVAESVPWTHVKTLDFVRWSILKN